MNLMYANGLTSALHGGRFRALLAASLLFLMQPSLGDDSAVDAAVEEQLRTAFGDPAIGLDVLGVEHSELPGLYRVEIDQGPVIYATADGGYFIVGDLYSVGASGLVNLGEQRRSDARREAVAAVPVEDTIIFPAEGETQSYLTVFTDVSCFYCQKLHKEVPELNRRGVEVRYLAYPRQGVGSEGFRQLASAWCADDRQGTLTAFKNRETLEENVCPGNPIAQQFELGQQLGVRGTPAIITPEGEMIPGYRNAEDLAGILGLN
jgi:thiol:disulfide interchange protein DsbC